MSSISITKTRPLPLLNLHWIAQRSVKHNGLPRRLFRTTSARLADTPDPNKPIVLEQPDKFRPPSHPSRIARRRKRMYYGRDLTEEDKAELDSKQYPYAFPPKQSFMHWFLTNRSIHLWITLSVLASLVILANMLSFHKSNRYPDLLPSASLFFSHPLRFLRAYTQVYRLNVDAQSADARANMDRNAEDVRRRREFRRAHGIPETTGAAAWLGLGTVEEDERRRVEEEERVRRKEELEREREREKGATEGGEVVVPKRKVFFGIWGW